MRRFGELAFGSVHPLFFIEGIQGGSLFYISEEYNLRGPNTYFSGHRRGRRERDRARRTARVRRGEADVALVRRRPTRPIFWWHMAAWDTLGVLTGRNDLGAGACAPYDRDRDGTVMGEGGAFFVLEDLEAAQRARRQGVRRDRRHRAPATDTRPPAHARPRAASRVAAAVERALARGRRRRRRTSATWPRTARGTRAGDASEAAALRAVARRRTARCASSVKARHRPPGRRRPARSTWRVAALAIDRGAMPPTLNLENLDPACEGVDWVPNEAREAEVDDGARPGPRPRRTERGAGPARASEGGASRWQHRTRPPASS